MSEYSSVSSVIETPVNPYSLLEAVNRSSDTSHTSWVIFLGIMTYLMIAVAGVSHENLLLETPVALPILQVPIPLAQFFQFAPIVLVLMHMGVVSQLVLLAKETLEFDHAIRLLEPTEERMHPLRLELNNFFFVQAIAGPQRSPVMSLFLHGMSWLTLVVMPVVLLLYIQVVFLPYHDIGITWTHRAALTIDIIMLILIGVFLMRAETSFIRAFMRTTAQHPVSFIATVLMLSVVALFSFFVATVPGEALDRMVNPQDGASQQGQAGTSQAAGFTLPFVAARSDGTLFGVFRRNLVVVDTDMVADKEQTPGEPSLSLRGRDLRYARFDRSDLHQADLTGADLQGASLVGTDLRGAWLHCSNVTELLLTADRQSADCTSARRADFSRAKLSGAIMTGIDLRSAKLEETSLEGANLAYALLTGADLLSARLDTADLTGGVALQGAQLLIANLQGADLTGASLQGADLSSASLQGAILTRAQLQGAVLRDAHLEATMLQHASLEGADMTGATVSGADLRGASVWQTKPPALSEAEAADFADLSIVAPDEDGARRLGGAVEALENPSVRTQVGEAVKPLVDPSQRDAWPGDSEHQSWQLSFSAGQALLPEDLKARLTDTLSRLMCRARWANGAIATGIARRAQSEGFRGDLVAIHDKLKSDECPASKTVAPKVLKGLSSAADVARGN